MPKNIAFQKSMDNATVEIIKKMAKKVAKACILIEGNAKENCPVDMGILCASIRFRVITGVDSIIGYIGSNIEYAPYVHQGTGIYALDGNGRKTPWIYEVKAGKYKGFHRTFGQKPNPFLADAVMSNKENVERILGGGQWN